MQELSDKNFGLLIAYVIPGFAALHALSAVSPTAAQWLARPPAEPSVTGFLAGLLASLGLGLFLSAVRWLTVDTILQRSGVSPPRWDFAQLATKLVAFDALVISHYRYYQFYANLFVVVPVWGVLHMDHTTIKAATANWCGVAVVEMVLLLAARDALCKYYRRAEALLREPSGLLRP
jgi:hypothetical protein